MGGDGIDFVMWAIEGSIKSINHSIHTCAHIIMIFCRLWQARPPPPMGQQEGPHEWEGEFDRHIAGKEVREGERPRFLCMPGKKGVINLLLAF